MQYESYSRAMEMVGKLAGESAVVIFSVSSCCMCHAVKRLFCSLGVHPTVYELDHHPNGSLLHKALHFLQHSSSSSSSSSNSNYSYDSINSSSAVPVVFIGGKLVGAMDVVMASHINGTLVPLLKEAGALWL